MRPGLRLCVALLIGVVLGAAAGSAQSLDDLSEQLRGEPFSLSADSLHYDMERALYTARGHVMIEQEGRLLRADWVAFNRRTGKGVASGNVAFAESGDVLHADFVEFELEVLKGQILGGHFESESSHFRVSAAEISKLGENQYAFHEGRFTTCRCDHEDHPVPWAIAVEDAELEVGGYAVARNARFEVFGVPLAWVPWAVFPVKTERQTGMLFPEFAFSSFHGFEIGLPFFWAIREEAGLVLTPRYSTDTGFGGAAAFDYAAGPTSEGDLLGAFYYDEEIDSNSPESPFGRNRWSASGTHHLALPAAFHLRSEHRNASDNDMPFDYRELAENRRDRFLESWLALSRDVGELGQGGLGAGARFVDDLQSPDDLDRDRFLLQRWPEAQADWLPTALAGVSWFVPSLDIDYAWFQARAGARGQRDGSVVGGQGVFLDTGIDALPSGLEPQPASGAVADPHADDFATTGGFEGDGHFQEGEPLADRGHRLLLEPRLALPLSWHGIQLVPEVGWHQTLYDSRRRAFRQRGFLTARADLRTRLSRGFGSWRHVVEPEVGYALALADSQTGNTLFVPDTAVPQGRLRALDLDSVTRDDTDRIGRAQQLTFGATNRLYGSTGTLRADFRLLGLFDFESDEFDAVILDGRAYPVDPLDLRFHVDLDPDRGGIDEGLGAIGYTLPAGLRFSGAYRWLREIPLFFEGFRAVDRFDQRSELRHVHQLQGAVSLDLDRRWSLHYQAAYTLEGQHFLANQGVLEYFSACGCWSVALQVSHDRTRDLDASLTIQLLGLGGDWKGRGPGLLDALRGLW